MNAHECVLCGRQVKQLLSQQINQISRYIDYLTEIKQAISRNKIDKLDELLEQQSLISQPVENSQQQQAEILTQYGYELSDKGFNDCIQDCQNCSQLQDLKADLTDKLQQLENSLIINALLVQKSQHRVKQSIRLLSGHELSNTASCYSRQGNIDSHEVNKHTLAQA